MDRTLGEWGRKCIGHWVNGIGEAHKNKTDQTPQYKKTKPPHQMAWEERRNVELGRVGRKCKGHWVNGVENPIRKKPTTPDGVGEKNTAGKPE